MFIYLLPICLGSIWWYLSLYRIIIDFNNKSVVRNNLIKMCIATICIVISLASLISFLVSRHN